MRPKIPESYHVHYSYYPCVSRRPPRGEAECVETLATSALVVDEQGNPVARGEAILSPDDVFSMRVAKDVALGRALRELETGLARGPFVTPSGRVVTEADLRALADEAEGPDRAKVEDAWKIKYKVGVPSHRVRELD